MNQLLAAWVWLIPNLLFAGIVDTISIESKVFGGLREVYVHLPDDMEFHSDLVRLPVIYVLDGQHEWFVNPVTDDIRYLQYTYEIPRGITVVIPHQDRMAECAIGKGLDTNEPLPLFTFITSELEEYLEPYRPNAYRLIIGHSLSASFALYAYQRGNGFFTSVIAHSPMDHLDDLFREFHDHPNLGVDRVSISTGGVEHDKDLFHREAFEKVASRYPEIRSRMTVYEADGVAHNAVPIVSNPMLLSRLFYSFSRRYGRIAQVDREYKLIAQPEDPAAELAKFQQASTLGPYRYAPEIGEIFGLASRYQNSGFMEQAIAVYEVGLTYYPKLIDLYLSLYPLYLEQDEQLARNCLLKAYALIGNGPEPDPEMDALKEEIGTEIRNKGWSTD